MAMDERQTRQMLPEGTLLQGGKYRVVGYLGSGGFGNTYEVENVELPTHYALKEFFMRGINQREGNSVTVSQEENREAFDHMRSKFYSEARRLNVLNEPHIVKVTDLFKENDTAYYVMELVNGSPLSEPLKQRQAFTEQQVRHEILPQILSALKYVHQQGIFHLDLKPANIMQSSDGHCWLIDFGASKQMSSAESRTLSTSTGLCYTQGFAPTEQVNGNTKRIGPWTDFYALGATLYNLLTAQDPPGSDDIQCDGASAFAFIPAVSDDMRSLIVWLMSPASTDRPQNVEAIEQRLKGQERVAKPASGSVTTKRATPQSQNKKPTPVPIPTWKIVAVMLPLGLLVLGVVLGLHWWKDQNDPVSHETVVTPPTPEDVIQNLINNMVYVEGGTFMMGATEGQGKEAYYDSRPAHQVTLSSFSIGKYEVTQEEWEAVMGTNPSLFKGPNRPVEKVSWDDCQDFIRELNRLTGKHFRLPTEAEWEFAARGGNRGKGYDNKFAGSSSIENVAWYKDNSSSGTHPVGQKADNELGLYDMCGNVREWVLDGWDSNDVVKNFGGAVNIDPNSENHSKTLNGSSSYTRVLKGGGWEDGASNCRPSWRGQRLQRNPDKDVGFRVVCPVVVP